MASCNFPSFLVTVSLLALAWKLLCGFLRLRRWKLLASLHPAKDAHALNLHTLYVEFPFLSQKSLEFGLFRTYAIPEISRVLVKGGQFGKNPSKRYDDTDILVHELLHHHVDSDRGSLALRRLNFLHAHYQIDNREYLYVLAIFILLPMEWASIYGHREWTELEKCAYYTTWRDIGTRMGIRDIPEGIQALSKLKEEYEIKHMVYSDSNKEIAEATMNLFLTSVPSFLWPFVRRIAYSLMDDRLLNAVGYPRQPYWIQCVSHGLLRFIMGTVVSWLPPRPLSWAVLRVPVACPKFQGAGFDPDALYKLAFQQYKPVAYEHGYRIKEVGSFRPGELGKAYGGDLICPLVECNNRPWPWPPAPN